MKGVNIYENDTTLESYLASKSKFCNRAKTKEETNESIIYEQLCCQKIKRGKFKICCIPFFVYEISLDDIVNTDLENLVLDVLESSGRSTFRVWFGNTTQMEILDDVLSKIKFLGGLHEWYSENLLAIDIELSENAQEMKSFLQKVESDGLLVYEIGVVR